MAEFLITNEHGPNGISNVIDVLRSPRLWVPTNKDYPDYSVWLDTIEPQIIKNEKRAMLAYSSKTPVGAVIYQRHHDHPNVIEIKNISIMPSAQGRYIGSFLLRNAELEGANNDFDGIDRFIVDTKSTNKGMLAFLAHHGYKAREISDLYGKGTGLDVILSKPHCA